jgi:hypothetical protein
MSNMARIGDCIANNKYWIAITNIGLVTDFKYSVSPVLSLAFFSPAFFIFLVVVAAFVFLAAVGRRRLGDDPGRLGHHFAVAPLDLAGMVGVVRRRLHQLRGKYEDIQGVPTVAVQY